MIKAIQDLKVDTQVRGSPRVPDIPRMFIKTRRVYTMNQTYSIASINLVAATNGSGAVPLTLGSTPLSSALATVFDAYKIVQSTVRFIPLGALPLSGGFNPMLTVIDYDDANILGSATSAQAYDNCQETPMGQYIERTFTPRVAAAVYNGSTFTGFAQAKSMWVDCSNPSVPHYGLKYFYAAPTTSYPSLYTIEADIIISFISVR